MTVIRARDNPRAHRWRGIASSARTRREARRALIEGAHLVAACLDAGIAIEALLVSESARARPDITALASRWPGAPVVLADALFASVVTTETPAGIAAEIAIPGAAPELASCACCVFLDRVQDAGNVGAILRSAAAFGIRDIVLGAGCADAWSPKVLRAGMGAHFTQRIANGVALEPAVERFGGRLACAVARHGKPLARADLAGRIGWLLGSEGQGVSEALAARASLRITIPLAAGVESLNVGAAAAILFYERARRLSTSAARA